MECSRGFYVVLPYVARTVCQSEGEEGALSHIFILALQLMLLAMLHDVRESNRPE